MILYFALSYSQVSDLKVLMGEDVKNCLTSYYPLRLNKTDINKLREFKTTFFLDSGAFSAFTKNVEIDIYEYIDFIKQWKDVWTTYAVLDVIGDWEATARNQGIMESAGLQPLPTFHYGSPDAELKRLVEEYDYIALGGLVPLALQRKKLEGWLDHCFSIIKADTRVHGFGVNSLWAWKRYPFYSVDATSWNQGSKFGRVIEFDGLKYQTVNRDDHEAAAMYYHNKGWKERTIANINTYLEAEKMATQLWTKRGIVWDNWQKGDKHEIN